MAINDNIYNALFSFDGETINEKVYHYLGSLGHTGTLNDRLGDYSVNDRDGWQAIMQLIFNLGSNETVLLDSTDNTVLETPFGVLWVEA